ncbi:hypothetical protein ACFT8W_20830 [Streptomyces hygroscopicus]|uniref:hypothetical protein n=1 Tax=Streptomyces hygroscopicus TaxID=1912 RepID=UPI003627F99A
MTVPAEEGAAPIATAPRSRLVAYLTRTSKGGYAVETREARNGRVHWRSQPWSPPSPPDGTAEGWTVPGLAVLTDRGREYVTAYAYGERRPGDPSVAVVSYRADASGRAVAPTTAADVPVTGAPESINADGTALVVRMEGTTASVAVATGTVHIYKGSERECTACADRMVAVVPKGPVLTSSANGYEVAGAWSSAQVTPPEYKTRLAELEGITADYLIGSWRAPADFDEARWVVHDAESGKALAAVTCSVPGNGTRRQLYTPHTSANGRYLVAGPVAFDLGHARGVCLDGGNDGDPVEFTAVDDDGLAFGTSAPQQGSDEPGRPVQVPLETGKPKTLVAGTLVPVAMVDGRGVFAAPAGEQDVRLTAYPRF